MSAPDYLVEVNLNEKKNMFSTPPRLTSTSVIVRSFNLLFSLPLIIAVQYVVDKKDTDWGKT